MRFDGDGNRITVVLDQKQNRQIFQAGGVERFPELAFAGCAFAGSDQRDCIGLRVEKAAGLRATYGLQKLSAGGRRTSNDILVFVAPVGRHLPSAGSGVGSSADSAQKHFFRSDAQSETERPVAIVQIEPVMPRLEQQSRRGSDSFMSSAADLEEDFILALQQNLAIVYAAGEVHSAVSVDQFFVAGQRRRYYRGF